MRNAEWAMIFLCDNTTLFAQSADIHYLCSCKYTVLRLCKKHVLVAGRRSSAEWKTSGIANAPK